MYTKTILAAAAVVAQAAAYSASGNYTLPACWSSCFAKYQVDSENCLCSDPLEAVVSSCVDSGCSAASSKAYEGWLYSYCNKAVASTSAAESTVTVETTSYTTICPVTETQTSGSATLTTSYQTTSTIVATTTKSVPVYSTIVTSNTYSSTAVVPKTSTYTETSGSATTTKTSTYESTATIVTSYKTTKTPGVNTWTSAPSAIRMTGTMAPSASGTGVRSYPSSPAPYKGAAANVQVAGALVGAGAIAALFL